MTTIQIDTNDENAIKAIKDFVMQKLHLKVKVIDNMDIVKSSDIDDKLKSLKSIKFEKKGTLHTAFSSLNKKLQDFKDIDIDRDKKEYFDKKYAL